MWIELEPIRIDGRLISAQGDVSEGFSADDMPTFEPSNIRAFMHADEGDLDGLEIALNKEEALMSIVDEMLCNRYERNRRDE